MSGPLRQAVSECSSISLTQRILTDLNPQRSDLLQSLPGAGDLVFSSANLGGVEVVFAEGAVDGDRGEGGVGDELGEGRVAVEVAFGGRHQLAGADLAEDVP